MKKCAIKKNKNCWLWNEDITWKSWQDSWCEISDNERKHNSCIFYLFGGMMKDCISNIIFGEERK